MLILITNMPKISVITVCRNEEDRILKTAQSISAQGFKDYEWILIDGASTDRTQAILEKFRPQIRHFVSEPDSGIFNAQNKGLKLATGEWLLFLNGGDFLVNSMVLENIAPKLTDASIVYGDIYIEDSLGNLSFGRSPSNITFSHLMHSTIWHPSAFIRRESFDLCGLYDESFKIVADYDFFLRAIVKYQLKTEYVPLPIAQFNTLGISSSKKFELEHLAERKRSQMQYFSPEAIAIYEEFAKKEWIKPSSEQDFRTLISRFFTARPKLKSFIRKQLRLK